MKVALVTESEADDELLRIILQACLGTETQLHDSRLRVRGWPGIRNLIPTFLKHLHYLTDVNACAILADADLSPLYPPPHDQSHPNCRMCDIDVQICETQRHLRPRNFSSPLRIAVCLAIPAIEAWLLNIEMPEINEAWWQQSCQSKPDSAMHQRKLHLKRQLYGTDQPSNRAQITFIREHERAIIRELPRLTAAFSWGLKPFVDTVVQWSA